MTNWITTWKSMTMVTSHAASVACERSHAGAASKKWKSQTSPLVSGGIATAGLNYHAIGSMASSFLRTKDDIVYLSASTLVQTKGHIHMDTITMKGAVIAVLTLGSTVQIWVASPTGDSSDSHIFEMPAMSDSHAQVIANMWRKAWDLPTANAPLEF